MSNVRPGESQPGKLWAAATRQLIEEISDARRWAANSYVQRARSLLGAL